MDEQQFRQRFPNASASCVAANVARARPVAEPQRIARDAALGAAQTKSRDSQRFLVRITSVRKRLLDEDNLVGKYHCDLLRYAGIIPSDAPAVTSIQTRQRKAAKGEAEEVVIEVFSA